MRRQNVEIPKRKKKKFQKVEGICLRIFIIALALGNVVYGLFDSGQISKFVPECVVVSFAFVTMPLQLWNIFSPYTSCLPYDILIALALDGLCTALWITATVLLCYWKVAVVYTPQEGDPQALINCADQPYWANVLTHNGWEKTFVIEWCPVEVDGHHRLVGSSAAIVQLHVLIGLSSAALFLLLILLAFLIRKVKKNKLLDVNWLEKWSIRKSSDTKHEEVAEV